jgi:hypothetical protein
VSEYVIGVGKAGPPLTEKEQLKMERYYRQLDGEELVELSPKTSERELPLGIKKKDIVDVLMKYEPEWEDKLWDCMKRAKEEGELEEDNKGVAVVKIKLYASKLIEGRWKRCIDGSDFEPCQILRAS